MKRPVKMKEIIIILVTILMTTIVIIFTVLLTSESEDQLGSEQSGLSDISSHNIVIRPPNVVQEHGCTKHGGAEGDLRTENDKFRPKACKNDENL